MKLNINGIEAELKFSMLQLERMNEISLELGAKASNQRTALVFSAIETAFKHKRQDNPFTVEDIALYVDDLSSTEEGNVILEQINEELNKSAAFKKLIETSTVISEDEKKSLLNGKMLELTPLEKSA